MDFNLTNYKDHPANSYYTVFYFKIAEHANYFESLLDEKEIGFEKADYEEDDSRFYFAVNNSHRKEVLKLNYLVSARFRKPFLPRALGWIVIVVTLFLIGLAIFGNWFSK